MTQDDINTVDLPQDTPTAEGTDLTPDSTPLKEAPQGLDGVLSPEEEPEEVNEEGEEPAAGQGGPRSGKPRPWRRRTGEGGGRGRLAAVLIGIVFFFAGIFKLMDPVGAGLVVEEYFKFFGTQFLLPVSKALAVGLALVETLCGLALMTGVYRRLTALVVSSLIVIFTLITFLLWRSGTQFDCGCFGEVIHLTPSQTFWKNVILVVLAAFAFIPPGRLGRGTLHKKIAFYIVLVTVLGLTVYSLVDIPLMDFTDFKPSVALQASGRSGPEHSVEELETFYVYAKDGVERRFRLEDIPDSTWKFVDTVTESVADMDDAPLPSLPISNREGEVCDSLAVGPDVMVVSVYRPRSLSTARWERIADFLSLSREMGFSTLLLAAVPSGGPSPIPEDVAPLSRVLLEECLHSSDYKTLLSLNRSNGGAVYFSDGYLIRKWSRRNYPAADDLLKLYEGDPIDQMLTESSAGRLRFQLYLLAVLAVVVLV